MIVSKMIVSKMIVSKMVVTKMIVRSFANTSTGTWNNRLCYINYRILKDFVLPNVIIFNGKLRKVIASFDTSRQHRFPVCF
jgi:hypothetical protein